MSDPSDSLSDIKCDRLLVEGFHVRSLFYASPSYRDLARLQLRRWCRSR